MDEELGMEEEIKNEGGGGNERGGGGGSKEAKELTLISSFMPAVQWLGTPQMKYLQHNKVNLITSYRHPGTLFSFYFCLINAYSRPFAYEPTKDKK